MGDNRLPLFPQQLDEPLLLFDQPVDAGGFVVEEGGDGITFFVRWDRDFKVSKIFITNCFAISYT